MSTSRKRTALATSILLALLVGAQASAQDAAKPDADNSSTLGTIIVTAEKRSEDVQQVPMSIGVIDETQIENLHATQLADYAPYIPGLTVVNGGSPGQAMLGIRGVAPLSAGSTVATYIDETPLGTSSNYGGGSTDVLDLLPFDFQSVEVLRGPQGTLFGRNATGGAIRFQTRPGGDIRGADLGTDFGSFGYHNEYLTIGDRGEKYEYMLFGSYVAGDGNTTHTGFHTTTENILATYAITSRDKVTFKFVNNDLNADLSIRLSRREEIPTPSPAKRGQRQVPVPLWLAPASECGDQWRVDPGLWPDLRNSTLRR